MSPKRLRCFVVGCNYEHSSHNLLPTSEPLKTQCIMFGFEGNGSLCLPKCICLCANFSNYSASPPEEVSISFLYEFCISPFLIMCYLASFTMNAAKVYNKDVQLIKI